MTTLQKRRLLFWLGLTSVCLLLFVLIPWKAAPVVLFFLLVFLSPVLEELYKLIVHRPVPPPAQQEEYPSYNQGLREVISYRPSDTFDQPKEAPLTEDVPLAQYPQQF